MIMSMRSITAWSMSAGLLLTTTNMCFALASPAIKRTTHNHHWHKLHTPTRGHTLPAQTPPPNSRTRIVEHRAEQAAPPVAQPLPLSVPKRRVRLLDHQHQPCTPTTHMHHQHPSNSSPPLDFDSAWPSWRTVGPRGDRAAQSKILCSSMAPISPSGPKSLPPITHTSRPTDCHKAHTASHHHAPSTNR